MSWLPAEGQRDVSDALRLIYVVSRWNQPTETFVRREVAAAVEAGASVQVLSLKPPGPPDGIVDDAAIRIVEPRVSAFAASLISTFVRHPATVALGLLRIVRLGRPGTWRSHLGAWAAAVAALPSLDDADLVLAHFAWVSSTAADTLSRLKGIPFAVFVHAHGIYEERCQDRYLTDRLQRAVVVFVESDRIANDVREHHGVEPVVMRMGVPDSYVVDDVPDRLAADGQEVVSVGALRKKKGHDLLIRAIAQLPSATLRIAGDGPERDHLSALVRDLGVDARTRFLGHRSLQEIRDLLDDASVFCLASRPTASGDRDGVPNVLIEAMARGVPIISTRVSGIPDLLEGVALLIDPDDGDALRGALQHLKDDPDHGAALASSALQRVRASYTTSANWDRMHDELVQRVGNTDHRSRG